MSVLCHKTLIGALVPGTNGGAFEDRFVIHLRNRILLRNRIFHDSREDQVLSILRQKPLCGRSCGSVVCLAATSLQYSNSCAVCIRSQRAGLTRILTARRRSSAASDFEALRASLRRYCCQPLHSRYRGDRACRDRHFDQCRWETRRYRQYRAVPGRMPAQVPDLRRGGG